MLMLFNFFIFYITTNQTDIADLNLYVSKVVTSSMKNDVLSSLSKHTFNTSFTTAMHLWYRSWCKDVVLIDVVLNFLCLVSIALGFVKIHWTLHCNHFYHHHPHRWAHLKSCCHHPLMQTVLSAVLHMVHHKILDSSSYSCLPLLHILFLSHPLQIQAVVKM